MRIEEQNSGPSLEQIRGEFKEKGYIVLEKGTEFNLELGYTPLGGEYIQSEALVAHERREIISHPELELKGDILVGEIVGFHRGEDCEDNLYKFTLTNAKILYLEERSREFQRDLITSFGIPEDYLETPYPEGLGDIDISLFRHYRPHAADLLEEKAGEDPYWEKLVAERKRLNRMFVEEYLGEDVDTERLESVRIVTRL